MYTPVTHYVFTCHSPCRYVRETLVPKLSDEERMAEIPVRFKRQLKMETKKVVIIMNQPLHGMITQLASKCLE